MHHLPYIVGREIDMASIFGVLAVCSVFSWPFFKHPRMMVLIQGVAAASFAAHFHLIGAATAALTSCCVLVQLLAIRFIKRRFLLRLCFVLSVIALFGLTAVRWQGTVSVLALAGCSLGTVARLQRTACAMKITFLVSAPLWVVHNIIVGSAFGLAVDVVSLTGNLCSLYRSRPQLMGRQFAPAVLRLARVSAASARSA